MYDNIEKERIKKNLSKTELAKKLNVDRKTYYNWERTNDIPASKLILMSKIFEVSIDYLLGRSEPVNESA